MNEMLVDKSAENWKCASNVAYPVEGWEKRTAQLVHPESFSVIVVIKEGVLLQLTEEELARMRWKLHMVERMAQKSAANMLKGTIKYAVDDHSPEVWATMAKDDGTDTLNYLYLGDPEEVRIAKAMG